MIRSQNTSDPKNFLIYFLIFQSTRTENTDFLSLLLITYILSMVYYFYLHLLDTVRKCWFHEIPMLHHHFPCMTICLCS